MPLLRRRYMIKYEWHKTCCVFSILWNLLFYVRWKSINFYLLLIYAYVRFTHQVNNNISKHFDTIHKKVVYQWLILFHFIGILFKILYKVLFFYVFKAHLIPSNLKIRKFMPICVQQINAGVSLQQPMTLKCVNCRYMDIHNSVSIFLKCLQWRAKKATVVIFWSF